MAKNKVSKIDVFEEAGVETLDEYFKALSAGFDVLVKKRLEQEKQVATAQRQALANFADDYARKRYQLEKLGIKNVEEYRRHLIEEFNKKQQEEELKLIREAQKEQYNIQTKYDKKRQAEERKAREQSNKEILEFYKQLRKELKEGEDLTDAQKAEEAKAKSENTITAGEKALNKTLSALTTAINKLDSGITKYSQYSAGINARLQGITSYSGENKFSAIETRLTNVVGINPYFRTETMLDNLQSLVEAGIASNVEQRAFLQTAKDDIATTFDAANGALLRIIRLQQSDSTAARLGMEAYLTRFLNELVENTEYLNQTFDNVQSALLEASSFMDVEKSTEFEYTVQKWLGALTGVGLSETTATNIAQALGAIGSGNVTGMSSEMLSLITMAASKSGLDIGALAESGFNANSANQLLQSLVEYMVEIGSNNSNVVKSQFAQAFGLTYSDLRAAQQLVPSLESVSGNKLSYADMYSELGSQLNTIPQRLATAQMMDTLWSNLEFGLASNIAKNPALAAIWKVTDLIQQNTGGINIPSVWTLPGGFDLNTTVENLVKLGVVGTSSLGLIGDLIGGLSSTFAPSTILRDLSITADKNAISRGTGLTTATSGLSTSTSVVTKQIATSSGEDISSGALTSASDSAKETLAGQQEEENVMDDIKSYLIEEFDAKLDKLLEYVSDLRDKVVDGQVDINTRLFETSSGSLYF